METKKNIDRLFQEKFKDFEVAPNDAVWDRISESLPNTKKKRRVIALWWQIGGVAAVIALLLTVGVSVFSPNDAIDLPIVNTDINTSNKTIDESKKLPKDKEGNETIRMVDSEQDGNVEEETSSVKEKTISKQLFAPNKTQTNDLANTPNKGDEATETQTQQIFNNPVIKNNNTNVAATIDKDKQAIKNSETSNLANESEIKSEIEKTLDNKRSAVAINEQDDNTSENRTDSNNNSESSGNDKSNDASELIESSKKQSIEDAIAQNTDNPLIEKEEENQSRWSVAPNVAPVYFSSMGQGSSIDRQFNENNKSSDISMSYGIAGTYAISDKLKVRAGVNRVDLNQRTTDVFAFSGAETALRGIDAQFSNITFNNGVQSVSLMSSKMLNSATVPELFITKEAGNVDQRFGFIEVPLELEYSLLDQKFGINVIGGFSTFFLNNNEIYADIEGNSTLIGKANNINSTSFSANFGLGFDYNLSKQWNLNLEPTFKYQLNTFNNTSGNYKPYFIGVYTGLSFKF
ncbi:MAG: hypothetical protein HKN40_08565 [Winogradskyella sp.]|uniref:hypothetical protein n=1 Tax=Winogradskyella sp. TaxID=1883156 RepID=UPI00178F46C3|nr:hypothetical protein [Winogradskyella sp.]